MFSYTLVKGLQAMRPSIALVVVLTAAVTLGALATVVTQEPAKPQPWLHVQIENNDAAGETVGVNLPVGAATALLSMAPNTVVENGQLQVGPQYGLSVSALRDLWNGLRHAGDTKLVTVQHGTASIRVARVGDRVEVRVDEADETVLAEVPVAVLDALLSGDGEALNIDAALETLSGFRGEIVHVTEKDRQIRVWIDEVADQ